MKINFYIFLLLPVLLTARVDNPDYLLRKLSEAPPEEVSYIYNRLAFEYLSFDNLSSIDYAEEAIKRNSEEDAEKLISYLLYGTNEHLLRYEEKSDYLKKAEELFYQKFYEDKEIEAYYKYFMGIVHFASGSFTEAIDALYRSVNLFAEVDNLFMSYLAQAGMSAVYSKLSKHTAAMELLEEPYEYFRDEGIKKYEILVLTERAMIKGYSGQIEEGEKDFNLALKITEESYRWLIPKIRNSHGNYYLNFNQMDKAYEFYSKTLELDIELPVNEHAYTLSNMSYISIQQQKFDRALKELMAIQELDHKDKYITDYSSNTLGYIYIIQKDFKNAEKYLLKCWNSIEGDAYTWVMRENLTYLAYLYSEQGEFEKAYNYQRLHTERYISYSESEDFKKLISRQDEISFEEKEKEIQAIKELEKQKYYSFVAIIILLLISMSLIIRHLIVIKKDKKLFKELSRTDPLTRLYNRRTFLEKAEIETFRYERQQSPFSIVLFDIDSFKNFNDSYGHECGDEVLKQVSGILGKSSRKPDVTARWGGEEFIILLPDTNLQGAVVIAERIRSLIEKSTLLYRDLSLSLTVTAGVAEFLPSLTLDEVIHQADLALLKGKDEGKNRVVQY